MSMVDKNTVRVYMRYAMTIMCILTVHCKISTATAKVLVYINCPLVVIDKGCVSILTNFDLAFTDNACNFSYPCSQAVFGHIIHGKRYFLYFREWTSTYMFFPSLLQENSKYLVYHPYKLIHCLCWWVLTYENDLMYVKYISIYYTNMVFHFLELTAALSLSASGMACLQRSGRGYFNHWISHERSTMQIVASPT